MENGDAILENGLALIKKLNIELPDDPAIPFRGIYTRELKTGGIQT